MSNIKVLVNVAFRDKYTGELYKPDGKPKIFTKERATEILNFNKNFITILGEVENEVDNGVEITQEITQETTSKTKPKSIPKTKTKSKVQEEFEALVK